MGTLIPRPIDPHIDEILDAVRIRRAAVLVAPPGAGKTTRVPAALIRSGLLDRANPAVVVLQPRRVAARSVAARIGEENGWRLGEEVGYHVRHDRRIGRHTRLRVVTEGILNRTLAADPFLEGVGAVILDEFHERSLHADLALALLREVRESARDDLIVMVMSATMDPTPVAAFLGDCPVILAPGRAFPVAVEYRGGPKAAILDRAASAVAEALDGEPGHVLVFLPGVEEIRRLSRLVGPAADGSGAAVLPLHGSLNEAEQDRALRPGDRRKVILATNVAETSLTIEGVSTVIDAGLARFAGFDPARGLDKLELGRISRASADQRAGRAGRTGPGRCIRLWSEREHRALDESDAPEIKRVDLAGTVLALHAWGQGGPARFRWFEPPTADAIDAAGSTLTMLGALESPGGPITRLGRRMLELPVHPRLARLLVAAAEAGCPGDGAAIAALLSERDIVDFDRVAERGRGTSDVLVRLDLLAEAERGGFAPGLRASGVDPIAARRVARVRDDLARLARKLGPDRGEADEATLLRLLLLAYPDRVARRRSPGEASGRMVGGRGVRLAPASVVREAEFFLALDPRDSRRGGTLEAAVRIASAVEVDWLAEVRPGAIQVERSVEFDPDRGRAVGVRRHLYGDLIVREDRQDAVDAESASAALAEAIRGDAIGFVRGDEAAARLLDRLAFLAERIPEADRPQIDVLALVDSACRGKRTLDEARAVPLAPLIRGALTFAEGRALDELAPEALSVPSGSRIKIDYEPGMQPVLKARLQELFGWLDTPKVAGGRVALVLHILGPNYRPVQVTDDLQSFWTTAYFQVRKDLRSRYPKHAWPDDPLSARAKTRSG